MSFLVNESMQGRVIEVTVSDRLTKEIYQAFVLRTQTALLKYGSIRALFVILGFRGWDLSAIWDDIPMDSNLLNDVERLAIVGERKWEYGVSTFCRPFSAATIRYLELRELEIARDWLRE